MKPQYQDAADVRGVHYYVELGKSDSYLVDMVEGRKEQAKKMLYLRSEHVSNSLWISTCSNRRLMVDSPVVELKLSAGMNVCRQMAAKAAVEPVAVRAV
jgi:hypothetical protein